MVFRGLFLAVAILSLSFLQASCGSSGSSAKGLQILTSAGTTANGSTADMVNVNYTVKLVNGSPAWTSDTPSVPGGSVVNATISNTTSQTHGFQIAELAAPLTVGPGETKTVQFRALYHLSGINFVSCHIHGAGVTPGVLNVTEPSSSGGSTSSTSSPTSTSQSASGS